MSEVTLAIVSNIALVVLILAGFNVMVALGVIGMAGLWYLGGVNVMISSLSTVFYSSTANFSFSVVPMFLLMGFFAARAGLGEDLFEAAVKWFGRLPGGLAVATTGGCAAFGGPSGSTVGTVMLFTKLALPPMIEHGYDKRLASASIAISGAIAALIPPSAMIVLYGILTDVSIGKLLLAGTIPGIAFAVFICGATIVSVMINPKLAPKIEQRFTWAERLWAIRLIGPLVFLIVLIVAGLYFGVFTPTEAGAAGAVTTLAMALWRQRGKGFGWVRQSILDTVQGSAMIFGIIVCGLIFSRFLAYGGITELIGDMLTGLDVEPWVIMLIITGIYIVLGIMMDAPAMLAVTCPVTVPVITSLGYDPVWFGVYVVVLAELGAITPPVGMNCFVVKSSADGLVSLEDVFKGVTPYILASLAFLWFLYLFPEMALWLPAHM